MEWTFLASMTGVVAALIAASVLLRDTPGIGWAHAGICLLGILVLGEEPGVAGQAAWRVLAALFPIFLVSGSLGFCGRAIPRWLVPAGFAIANHAAA